MQHRAVSTSPMAATRFMDRSRRFPTGGKVFQWSSQSKTLRFPVCRGVGRAVPARRRRSCQRNARAICGRVFPLGPVSRASAHPKTSGSTSQVPAARGLAALPDLAWQLRFSSDRKNRVSAIFPWESRRGGASTPCVPGRWLERLARQALAAIRRQSMSHAVSGAAPGLLAVAMTSVPVVPGGESVFHGGEEGWKTTGKKGK